MECKDPTLDAYAEFAAGLSDAQIVATARFRPLVRFSIAPFSSLDRVRALALFGALSPSERQVVRTTGLPYVQMSAAARARWDRAYGDIVLEFPSSDGTYLDLLGGKRPEDAGLRITAGFTVSRGTPGRDVDGNPPESRYAADQFVWRLDPHSGFSLVTPIPSLPLKAWANGS